LPGLLSRSGAATRDLRAFESRSAGSYHLGNYPGDRHGSGNIYSAPEYAFGGDGATWLHVAAHLFVGTIVGSLVPWLFGSLILLLTRKLSPVSERNVKSLA